MSRRPRSIADAMAGGMELDPLGCAAHEVGHGIAFHQTGIPVRRMRIWPERVGWNGVCEPAVNTIRDELVSGWLVGVMAGAAAAYRFFHKHARLGNRRSWEIAEASLRYDLPEFHRLSSKGGLSLADARTRTSVIVERHGARIDRLTLRLATDHQLPGSAL